MNILINPSANPCNGNIADVRLKGKCLFGKLRISKDLQKNRIRVVQVEVVGYQIRSINCGESIITAENFGVLMISYSEIGGHVLTPFLGTCPYLVECRQAGQDDGVLSTGWMPIKEGLDMTKSIGGDVSVPMATTRKSADGYDRGVCR